MVNLLIVSVDLPEKTFYKIISYFDFLVGLVWLLTSATELGESDDTAINQGFQIIGSFVLYSTSFCVIVAYMKHRSYKTRAHAIYAISRMILATILAGIGMAYIIIMPLYMYSGYYNSSVLAVLGLLFLNILTGHQLYLSYQLLKIVNVIEQSDFNVERLRSNSESLGDYISIT